MKKLVLFVVTQFLAVSLALAQAPACEAQAVSKDGKPLVGAAKQSFMKKCQREQGGNACEAKAIDKNGKPLAGAAKNSFMKKCQAGQ